MHVFTFYRYLRNLVLFPKVAYDNTPICVYGFYPNPPLRESKEVKPTFIRKHIISKIIIYHSKPGSEFIELKNKIAEVQFTFLR